MRVACRRYQRARPRAGRTANVGTCGGAADHDPVEAREKSSRVFILRIQDVERAQGLARSECRCAALVCLTQAAPRRIGQDDAPGVVEHQHLFGHGVERRTQQIEVLPDEIEHVVLVLLLISEATHQFPDHRLRRHVRFGRRRDRKRQPQVPALRAILRTEFAVTPPTHNTNPPHPPYPSLLSRDEATSPPAATDVWR